MRKKISLLTVFVLLALTVASVIFQPTAKKVTQIQYMNKNVTGYITEDAMVEYIFTPENDIRGLKLLIATYEKKLPVGS